MDALLQWCDLVGILVDSRLQLCKVTDDNLESEQGSHALVANETIGAGELLVHIPDNWVISRRTVPSFGGNEELALALSLLCELQKGSNSRFHGYLQSLPRASVALAWEWNSPESSWMTGTEAERMLRRAKWAWSAGNSDGFCIAQLQEYWAEYHRHANLDVGLWPKFVDAYSLVSSRAFVLDEWHGLAMVPIADIFNHTDTHNVHVEADIITNKAAVPSSGIIVRSVAEIEAGEEAINSYGELSNAELLCRYGFVLDARTGWERSSWSCSVPEELAEIVSAFGLRESTAVSADALTALEPHCANIQREKANDGLPPSFVDERGEFDYAPVLERDKIPLFIDAMGRPSWPLWQLAVNSVLHPSSSLCNLVEMTTSELVCWPADVKRRANEIIARLCEQRLKNIRVSADEDAALEAISHGKSTVQACALHALQESDMLGFSINRTRDT